ncbi:hypothetical protein FOYG_09725 [Fusarium oxysporum NRRL 32931]|uniref:Uncharacterized protein n=1 Tax=Fusarium oxysporum NRRL 32931 TaxID=660029 RepID=W9I7W6_FUSOX|nr:hypothetical protein FOYG_09725 [Fusarium oxysporum NRRL 32931]
MLTGTKSLNDNSYLQSLHRIDRLGCPPFIFKASKRVASRTRPI